MTEITYPTTCPRAEVRYVTYWLLLLLLLHSTIAHVVEHFALRLLLDVVVLDARAVLLLHLLVLLSEGV